MSSTGKAHTGMSAMESGVNVKRGIRIPADRLREVEAGENPVKA
jgi:hypothetical protein